MRLPENKNDWFTVAAVSVLAMCVVTFDHEALGHGSVCLALHGHILLLSSSLFRCDVRSGWIDPAGPVANVLMGTVALVCLRLVPVQRLALRVFLIFMTAFSYFWESGYLIHAMHRQYGDLYFFAEFLLGHVTIWERTIAIVIGVVLYVVTARIISNELLRVWPQRRVARSVARIAWISATVGAAVAALAYRGHGWGDFTDAVLEFGGSSFLLLLIPLRSGQIEEGRPAPVIARSRTTIVLAAIVYAVFVASLGRGIMS
ncbi:MAG TPA: hypothetical protein VMF56_15325 [Acidobacteriaceae bacterium]|nr:hypothetical protein [Acidobacteriaceae bacterium]